MRAGRLPLAGAGSFAKGRRRCKGGAPVGVDGIAKVTSLRASAGPWGDAIRQPAADLQDDRRGA